MEEDGVGVKCSTHSKMRNAYLEDVGGGEGVRERETHTQRVYVCVGRDRMRKTHNYGANMWT
jgi:hypothetical protein